MVSRPPSATPKGDSCGDADCDEVGKGGGDVDCQDSTLANVYKKRPKAQGYEGSSLTGAALGGRTFPSSVTVHPLGRPGYVVTVATGLFWRVVGTQGYIFGVTKVEVVSRWVPWNGIGALFEDAVTAGGAAPTGTTPLPPPEFTLPPTAWIESQVPLVPE